MTRVTVFTGSHHGSDPAFIQLARALGRRLAQRGIGVVYGGGNVGLMGVLADAALQAGGEVHGVMPRGLAEEEIAHPDLTRLDIVEDMHQRKQRMAELGDAFLAMPGGAGTLEELFEVWTWQHLGIHDRPVGLLDVGGFWAPLQEMVDHMVRSGFLTPARRDALIIEAEVETLITRLVGGRTADAGMPSAGDGEGDADERTAPAITLVDSVVPPADQLCGLYGSVGWSAYTEDSALLHRGVCTSFRVVTAWAGEELVGLARIISDGATIAYLQDVLVHPDHQGLGLGRRLVEQAFGAVAHIRQHVLITDAEPGQRAFYEALGFTEVRDTSGAGMRCFVRVRPAQLAGQHAPG